MEHSVSLLCTFTARSATTVMVLKTKTKKKKIRTDCIA